MRIDDTRSLLMSGWRRHRSAPSLLLFRRQPLVFVFVVILLAVCALGGGPRTGVGRAPTPAAAHAWNAGRSGARPVLFTNPRSGEPRVALGMDACACINDVGRREGLSIVSRSTPWFRHIGRRAAR
jgi:hypothetical protein